MTELGVKLAVAEAATGSSEDLAEQIATVKQHMQSEREAALLELEQINDTKMKKAKKATLLMICL